MQIRTFAFILLFVGLSGYVSGEVLPDFRKGRTYEIKEEIDLGGKTVHFPQDVVLRFNGGRFKNGILVGEETGIESTGCVFDNVIIKGTWIVPVIRTSMFKDLRDINSLKNVLALSSGKCHSKIVIESGEYWLKAVKNGESILKVHDNIDITLDGTIRLVPNVFASYNVLHLAGQNIMVSGTGTIIGDRSNHLGNSGEWGMGIMVSGTSVSINGLRIKDCWGDCIYIGGESKNVFIKSCVLEGGRRQGISITSANDVRIENCIFTNVGGTDPEYAIDIEPNKGDVVSNVRIEQIKIENCRGGVCIYGRSTGAKVSNIMIRRSFISGDTKTALSFIKCENVTLEKCSIVQDGGLRVVDCQEVSSVVVRNNKMTHYQNKLEKIEDDVKKLLGQEISSFIRLYRCSMPVVISNIKKRIVK